jgi:hypothetical protein
MSRADHRAIGEGDGLGWQGVVILRLSSLVLSAATRSFGATTKVPACCSLPAVRWRMFRAECVAFVKGVEVVLDYMLKVKDVKSAKSLLNQMLEAREFEIPAKPAE